MKELGKFPRFSPSHIVCKLLVNRITIGQTKMGQTRVVSGKGGSSSETNKTSINLIERNNYMLKKKNNNKLRDPTKDAHSFSRIPGKGEKRKNDEEISEKNTTEKKPQTRGRVFSSLEREVASSLTDLGIGPIDSTNTRNKVMTTRDVTVAIKFLLQAQAPTKLPYKLLLNLPPSPLQTPQALFKSPSRCNMTTSPHIHMWCTLKEPQALHQRNPCPSLA